ncbi:hypothetical protein O181_035312 [Austropuccinia psidii MF-1]|uniref:Uncharacterized protein n=1 Tax=Austropuccinia psidii MF-1 TaxID=1389203 RepID=A0A9Q3H8W3_9BASI|nr:hypothetical protein [Austropuccinia psidii MF-1]
MRRVAAEDSLELRIFLTTFSTTFLKKFWKNSLTDSLEDVREEVRDGFPGWFLGESWENPLEKFLVNFLKDRSPEEEQAGGQER